MRGESRPTLGAWEALSPSLRQFTTRESQHGPTLPITVFHIVPFWCRVHERLNSTCSPPSRALARRLSWRSHRKIGPQRYVLPPSLACNAGAMLAPPFPSPPSASESRCLGFLSASSARTDYWHSSNLCPTNCCGSSSTTSPFARSSASLSSLRRWAGTRPIDCGRTYACPTDGIGTRSQPYLTSEVFSATVCGMITMIRPLCRSCTFSLRKFGQPDAGTELG